MAMNPDSTNDRLSMSANGTPQINPDERHRYLGTFRERVDLVIPIKDMGNPDAQRVMGIELGKHPNYVLTINDQVDTDLYSPYLQIASKHNVTPDLVSDDMYKTKPDCNGVVFAAKSKAINHTAILWSQIDKASKAQNKPKSSGHKTSVMDKIKHWL